MLPKRGAGRVGLCSGAWARAELALFSQTSPAVQGRPEQVQSSESTAALTLSLSRQEQSPTSLRGCSSRSPLKKAQTAAPSRDYALNTLTQLEVDLVKFVSKVRNAKSAMVTGSNLRLHCPEVNAAPHSVTIYEIWGEEDSE